MLSITARMFSIERRTSPSKLSDTILPVASTEAWPDTKTNGPTLTQGENGRCERGEIEPRVCRSKPQMLTQRALDDHLIEWGMKRDERRLPGKSHKGSEALGRQRRSGLRRPINTMY